MPILRIGFAIAAIEPRGSLNRLWIKAHKKARSHSPIELRITYQRQERQEISVALSQLRELGEQAVVAVAASLVDGGAVLKAQLIASRFYEALRHELEESSMDDAKLAALTAASDRCERIAAASINSTALLDQLKKAVAVLQTDTNTSPPPPRARPVLRVIDGGLSS